MLPYHAYLMAEFSYSCDELSKLVLGSFAAKSEIVCNLCIAFKCMRVIVLRECSHFCWSFRSIEAQHIRLRNSASLSC